MKRLRSIILLSLSSMAFGWPGAGQDRLVPGVGSTDIPAFLERLDVLRDANGIPGLSVAVVQEQALVLAAGLGYADLEKHTPATAETLYNVASVAKPLSAVVAFRLVEQGVLDLDRPMSGYSAWAEFCMEFSQQPSIFARGLRCHPLSHTLRHLLTHTATGTPGTKFSYNPVLYSWASRPIMAVGDAPFSTLVERYVFAPAGMDRSARIHRDLSLPRHLEERLAPPHRVDPSGAIGRAPDPPPQGDGARGVVLSRASSIWPGSTSRWTVESWYRRIHGLR